MTHVRQSSRTTIPTSVRTCRLPVRRGLGLVELLITLAITAMLLTAVAVATVASSNAVREADTFNRAAQTARVSLNLMLCDVRRGQPDPASCTSTQLRVLTAENIDKTYRYNATDKQILMFNNDIAGDPGRVVARDVTALTFAAESSGTPTATRHVAIDIAVSVGRNTVHFNGSASPRQNATY
jgi:prepilin-type N-terminal cleavage/methylation domain-containing protein